MIGPVDLTVDAFATARLTRLITADRITRRSRADLIRKVYGHDHTMTDLSDVEVEDYAADDPDSPFAASLLTCGACCSVWIAFGVCVARRLMPRVWGPVARMLAVSQAALLLNQ